MSIIVSLTHKLYSSIKTFGFKKHKNALQLKYSNLSLYLRTLHGSLQLPKTANSLKIGKKYTHIL